MNNHNLFYEKDWVVSNLVFYHMRNEQYEATPKQESKLIIKIMISDRIRWQTPVVN